MEGLTPALLDGARSLVKFSNIQAGDNVIIFVDRPNDDALAVRAIEMAVDEVGAVPVTIRAKEWAMRFDEPPRPIEWALKGADFVIDQSGSLNPKGHYMSVAMKEYGITHIMNEAKTAEVLASEYVRFPGELLFAIAFRVTQKIVKAKRLRVTTPKGTDIAMGIHPRRIGSNSTFDPQGRPDTETSPGTKRPFPGLAIGIHPEDPVSGVIMVESIYPGLNPPKVILKDPLRIVIEDHWATEISGEYSDWVKEMLVKKGDENSRWLGERMWGVNPKGYPFGWPDNVGSSVAYYLPMHNRSDMLHFALGMAIGGAKYSKLHADFYTHKPTVYLDGEKIIEDGHLLVFDDPEIREIAKKYGDPDKILSTKPLPRGMFD